MNLSTHGEHASVVPARGLGAALDWACAAHTRAAMLLVAFSLIAFLPGFFRIPPVDRDEPRFAQATKQMVEGGDFIDIRFQNQVRYKKPVGIYWLQAEAVKSADALGLKRAHTRIWIYRLSSLAGAIGAVLLTYWAALGLAARRAALLAALMMASSILLGTEARLAKTDAVLLLTCVAAMGAMARVYLNARRMPGAPAGWALPAIFWTALAGGILVKGPLILMIAGLAAIALSVLDRSARWMLALRPVAGLIFMLALVSPWFIAIVSRSGDSFFAQSLGDDMLSKVTSGQETHGAPPGYYVLLYWLTFWPGSVLTGFALPAVWRERREPATQFLLAWVVPSLIVFEAVPTKLPHYVLPLYPAIAILIAAVLEQGKLATARWMHWGTLGWFVFPLSVSALAVVVSVSIGRDLGLAAWPFAGAAMIAGLFAWRLYAVDGPERALLRGMVASVFVAIAVYAITVPSLPGLFPSAIVGQNLRASDCVTPKLASAGYEEPSLVFLAGTDTVMTDGAGAAEFLRKGDCHFALIDARRERSFVQRADAVGLRYTLIQKIEGYSISYGHEVTLSLFRSAVTP